MVLRESMVARAARGRTFKVGEQDVRVEKVRRRRAGMESILESWSRFVSL